MFRITALYFGLARDLGPERKDLRSSHVRPMPEGRIPSFDELMTLVRPFSSPPLFNQIVLLET